MATLPDTTQDDTQADRGEQELTSTQNDELVTVAVPTKARPKSLQKCLETTMANTEASVRFLILDSTPSNVSERVAAKYRAIYAHFGIEPIYAPSQTPPGAARAVLAKMVKTPFVQFIDDDMRPHRGAIDHLLKAICENGLDIVSGLCVEYGYIRALGFVYSYGNNCDGNFVLKCPVHMEKKELTRTRSSVLMLDDVMPNMLCRTKIFDQVNFDSGYHFYLDLYDFFMTCKNNKLRVACIPASTFSHVPGKYPSVLKDVKGHKEEDIKRFYWKWGVWPRFAPKDYGGLKRRIAMQRRRLGI